MWPIRDMFHKRCTKVLDVYLKMLYQDMLYHQSSLHYDHHLHLLRDPLNGYRHCFHGGKQPEREVDHSTYTECGG